MRNEEKSEVRKNKFERNVKIEIEKMKKKLEAKNEKEKEIKRLNNAFCEIENRKHLWNSKYEIEERKYNKYIEKCGAEIGNYTKRTHGKWGKQLGKYTTKSNFQWKLEQSNENIERKNEKIILISNEELELNKETEKQKDFFYKTDEKSVIIYGEKSKTAKIVMAEIWENKNGKIILKIKVGHKKNNISVKRKEFEENELNEKVICNGRKISVNGLLKLATRNSTEIYKMENIIKREKKMSKEELFRYKVEIGELKPYEPNEEEEETEEEKMEKINKAYEEMKKK